MNISMESVRRAAADLFPELASHVWSSTIFLLAVLAILWVLRRRLTAGAVRYINEGFSCIRSAPNAPRR